MLLRAHISSPKPAGDKGGLEKTNISEKANKTKHPNSIYPSLAAWRGLGESRGRQLSFNPWEISSVEIFRQLCNFDFQLIRFVLFGRLG